MQHRVMIEAVENHMPEIVIVDEIGTEAEAIACRTIAERGVQVNLRTRLVQRENIPPLPASDWLNARIYPRFPHLIGSSCEYTPVSCF
eukprot:1756709-Pyramimonas_sp.AAC.1